ncbi:hypothetical protein FIBSPDRAFT_872971 [Athelia psychrophila]|uniref:Uncharacterized protein n=1 Tax=Athelia psychrophila TaxID=1759441 RepID=A0A165Z0T7_9AGAM|nr:hypothetical protein FIBSPDRAFT_872971 [Fibularhizoctonia sp. CBS 109695]
MSPYIQGIQVIYTDGLNPPAGYVQEEDKKMEDADINKGHGGKYVWIVPVWTDEKSKAVVGFKVVRRQVADQFSWTNKNLAEAAGGDLRYLVPEMPGGSEEKDLPLLSLWLKREGHLTQWTSTGESGLGGISKQALVDGEYHGKSGDINAGRGGDYLYLCYKLDYDNPIEYTD